MPEDNQEVSLDNVIQTGEDGNRIPNPNPTPDANLTPEQVAAKAEADRIAAEGGTPPANTPPANPDGLTEEEIAKAQQENSDSLNTLFSSFADETKLDDNNKAIRSQLLEKHSGTAFNANGDILNDKGEIVIPASDLVTDALKEDEVVLDDKGNQVDTDGKIIKTNVEIAVDTTVVNKLHADSEYEFVDEAGNTKIYADDDAGMNDYANDVATERFENFKTTFFAQTPDLAEVTKHLLSGKSIDTYDSAIDYNKLDTTTMSKDDKLKYIRKSFEVTGLSEERINGLVQLFVDSNTVDAEVVKALPALQANEVAVKEQRDTDYQQSIDERNNKMTQYWNDVEATVSKGVVNNVAIPEAEKTAFFDYLSAVVDDKGNSQEMLDTKKETLEQQLQFKFLRYKGYDLSKLVKDKVKTERVLSLRERIKNSAKLKTTPLNANPNNVQTSGKDITIDELLG